MPSLYIWSLSSLLELLGRLSRVRRSSLYWHLSDSRRMTLSDQHPWIFICSTIYYGSFPHTFFSSDELLLKNGTVSPAQRLKFWPPQLLLLLFIFENHEKKWNWFELKDRELLLLFLDCEDGELLNSLRKHNTFSLTFVSFNKQSHFRLILFL